MRIVVAQERPQHASIATTHPAGACRRRRSLMGAMTGRRRVLGGSRRHRAPAPLRAPPRQSSAPPRLRPATRPSARSTHPDLWCAARQTMHFGGATTPASPKRQSRKRRKTNWPIDRGKLSTERSNRHSTPRRFAPANGKANDMSGCINHNEPSGQSGTWRTLRDICSVLSRMSRSKNLFGSAVPPGRTRSDRAPRDPGTSRCIENFY